MTPHGSGAALAGIATAHWPDRRHCHWQEHRGALTAGSAGATAVLYRAALGAIVFAQPAEKAWLEALVHPLVRARFEQELHNLRELPTVVLMIPLHFEAGLEALCSEIWLGDCEPTQQLERLMQRDGLSKSNAKARISTNEAMSRKEHSQTGYFQTRKINSQHYITQKAFQETKQQKS